MTAFLLKLQPNQDVTEALENAVRVRGMAQARIVAAVGSLVEGTLWRDGIIHRVPGPGIEVAALSGDVFSAGGSRLHGYLCREDTVIVEGLLQPGLNAVGVTFEVLLQASEPQ